MVIPKLQNEIQESSTSVNILWPKESRYMERIQRITTILVRDHLDRLIREDEKN